MSERQSRKRRQQHKQWRVNTITAILRAVFVNPTMQDEEVAKRAHELDTMNDVQLRVIAHRMRDLQAQAQQLREDVHEREANHSAS